MSYEEELRQEGIVEAVLFTMGKSVELRQLAAALDCDEYTARQAVLRLKDRYEQEDRAMQIIELEDSWQMCTKKDFYEALIKVAKTPKKQVLTEAVLETLSIVAYKQPVTRTELDRIRGVSCEYALNRLIEYGLVYEAGRLDAPGRPSLFATTEEFLRRFGIGSKSALPEIDHDREAEIVAEVTREVGYWPEGAGTAPETDGRTVPADAAETADAMVEAVAKQMEATNRGGSL